VPARPAPHPDDMPGAQILDPERVAGRQAGVHVRFLFLSSFTVKSGASPSRDRALGVRARPGAGRERDAPSLPGASPYLTATAQKGRAKRTHENLTSDRPVREVSGSVY
jgi:hypothetical protein